MRHILVLFGLAWFTLPSPAQQKPASILIAYHSQTGNTEKFAKAVSDGAASVSEVRVLLKKAGTPYIGPTALGIDCTTASKPNENCPRLSRLSR